MRVMYLSSFANRLCIQLCVVVVVVIIVQCSCSSAVFASSGPSRNNRTSGAAVSYGRKGEERGMNYTTLKEEGTDRTQQFQFLNPKPADVVIECKALRSKRYITDGFCTSLKPVEDMVCTGNCLPISDLPWYAEFIKVWSRTKTLQYRCVDDSVRYKKVTFVCDSGETRSYKIRVVRSCKCKRYLRNQNESPADDRTNDGQRRLQKLSNLSNDGRK